MTANPDLRIEIRDFGVFEVKTTKPKPKARNLKTGEFVFVPARKKMHFKPGKLHKEYLNKPLD
jgi:integration host factor subunit beta